MKPVLIVLGIFTFFALGGGGVYLYAGTKQNVGDDIAAACAKHETDIQGALSTFDQAIDDNDDQAAADALGVLADELELFADDVREADGGADTLVMVRALQESARQAGNVASDWEAGVYTDTAAVIDPLREAWDEGENLGGAACSRA